MGASTLTAEGHTARGSDALLPDLLALCADSVAACFSRDPAELRVPVGLGSLSALLLLLSRLAPLCGRRGCRGGVPGEAVVLSYCFLGDLCGAAGAVLSRQLCIQVLLGAFAAAVDAVGFLSCCVPVLLCWDSKTERRLRMMKRRRRQHLLAVCVLMVVAGGFLKPGVTQHPAGRPFGGRTLLLHATLQDNAEILGYALGSIALAIACTSRFPALRRAYRGQMLTRAYMFSGLLCSLAGALYAAAILYYDTQPGFLLRAMPWLLSALCCVTLELLILVLHWCKTGTGQRPVRLSPDAERLLGGSGIPTDENAVPKKRRKQKVDSSAETKTNAQATEMGRYMDVSIRPATKMCPQEVTSSGQGAEDRPLSGTVRVIGVDSSCFSDTSCDSSLVSSDLEWDFEEANGRWREPTTGPREGYGFPLRGWPPDPKPCDTCTCAMLALPLSGREEG